MIAFCDECPNHWLRSRSRLQEKDDGRMPQGMRIDPLLLQRAGCSGYQIGSPLCRLAGVDAAVSFERRRRAAGTNIEDGKSGAPLSPRCRGNGRLRVVRHDARARPWLKALLARWPFKVAAVAQANKTARIIWALLNKGRIYRHPAPFAHSRDDDQRFQAMVVTDSR